MENLRKPLLYSSPNLFYKQKVSQFTNTTFKHWQRSDIKGVGENSWLKANYSHDDNIEIEGIQFKWSVIIADITD